MHKFKIGDRVKLINILSSNATYGCLSIGALFIVEGEDLSSTHNVLVSDGSRQIWLNRDELELVESNNINSNMSIKQKFAEIFMSEPNKSFRKAGITNSDYSLTTEGQDIFLQWLLKKNGDAFKTEVVDELLKEENK